MIRAITNRTGVTKSMKKTRASPAFFHFPLLNGQTTSSLVTPESVMVVLGDSSSVIDLLTSSKHLMTIPLWTGISTIVFSKVVLVSTGGR